MYKTLSEYNNCKIIEKYLYTEKPKKYEKDLVSVIIPTYNRYKFLLNAIKSVQEQTYKNIEIIVVNDCSTEKEYKSGHLEKMNKVKVVHLPINLRIKYNVQAAQGRTRDNGIKIAKGEWIAFLDDDDYWLPQKLEKQMKVLKENKKILMSSTNMFLGDGGLYNKNKKYALMISRKLPNIFEMKMIETENLILNSTVILHKNIIDKVGEFDLGTNEDWKYWKRTLKYTNCYYIDEPLVYYDTYHADGKNYVYDSYNDRQD